MQKQINSLAALLLLSTFIFTGCDKKDDPAPVVKTKTQLATQGSWSFDKAMSGTTDISASVPACYKDNVVTFTSGTNGTVTNTVVCTPTDITPATFTWSFQTSETILHLSAPLFPGGSSDFNLVSLTETSLVVSQTVTFPPGPPTNVVFYYKH